MTFRPPPPPPPPEECWVVSEQEFGGEDSSRFRRSTLQKEFNSMFFQIVQNSYITGSGKDKLEDMDDRITQFSH